MSKPILSTAIATTLFASATMIHAEPVRVIVSVENLAPARGTFQTPFWVGFHDGSFDTYNGATPANARPLPGSIAMESICEDGSTDAISSDFATIAPGGVDATLTGPSGPIAPGETAVGSFLLESTALGNRYFSYASMIIPSNDFCVSNGDPLAHPIFDEAGNVIASDFFVTGAETLDAGTEVNDELPENTAFFGQQAPNTGVDEGALIGDVGDLPDFSGFRSPDDGGNILADARFAMGDFTRPGYPIVKVSFATAPAITDDLDFKAVLSGNQEVPPVVTRVTGLSRYELRDEGTRMMFRNRFSRSLRVSMAHLHLGGQGENGPVVVNLLSSDDYARRRRLRRIVGELDASDLTGPLTGQPLDALIAEIASGNVYINIHTPDEPAGLVRGQLLLADD